MISETDNDYSGPNYPGTVHCCNQTLQSQVHTTMVGTALQWGQVLLQSKTFKKLEFKMFIVWNMSCLFSVFSSAWAEFSFCLKFNLERRPDFRRKYKESSFKSSIRAYTLKHVINDLFYVLFTFVFAQMIGRYWEKRITYLKFRRQKGQQRYWGFQW